MEVDSPKILLWFYWYSCDISLQYGHQTHTNLLLKILHSFLIPDTYLSALMPSKWTFKLCFANNNFPSTRGHYTIIWGFTQSLHASANIRLAIPTRRLSSMTHLSLNLIGQVLPLFSVVVQQLWHPHDTPHQLHSSCQVTVLCAHSWGCWMWCSGSSGCGAGGGTGCGGATTGAASCLCLSHLQ